MGMANGRCVYNHEQAPKLQEVEALLAAADTHADFFATPELQSTEVYKVPTTAYHVLIRSMNVSIDTLTH